MSVTPKAPAVYNASGSCTADRSIPAAAKLVRRILRLCQLPIGAACNSPVISRPAARSQRWPGRFDARNPANAAKLDAADALGALADEAGLTLIQMAIAFVTRHPAVTCAIIGPRTIEHLDTYLAADGIDLSNDLLDRIDQIVPPAVTINVADNMWPHSPTALSATLRRR